MREMEYLENQVTEDINAMCQPNTLCSTCDNVASTSELLKSRVRQVPPTAIVPVRGGFSELCVRIEEFPHKENEKELRSSAVKGCHLCTLLYQKLHRLQQLATSNGKTEKEDCALIVQIRYWTWDDSREQRMSRITKIQRGEIRIGMQGKPESMKGEGLSIEPERPLRSDIITRSRHSAQLNISTASKATFDLAQQWVQRCIKEHTVCRDTYSSSLMFPTRLLDLGSLDYDKSISLRATKDIISNLPENTRPVYTTLTHRWGKASTLRLLKSNETELLNSIPFTNLPRTFQDAVTITRRLGYSYLWIDSLCIIQDSPVDWEHESAIMGEIYCGSILTISALAAKDSHEGFFVTRNPLLRTPCRLTSLDKLEIVAVNSRLSTEPLGELLLRGWVVQERIMSPRSLHFGVEGIFWECSLCQANELAPEFLNWQYPDPRSTSNSDDESTDSFPRRFDDGPKSHFIKLLDIGSDFPGDLTRPTEHFLHCYSSWIELLNVYTSCGLTMPDDKLVAINGIISKVHRHTKLTSVAGLWKELFPVELLWYSHWNANNPCSRPSNYRAPSWSWAAVDCSGIHNPYVELNQGRDENLQSGRVSYTLDWKTIGIDVTTTQRPNGQVTNAHLRVQGPSRKVQWAENKGSHVHPDAVKYRNNNDRWYQDDKLPEHGNFWALLIARGRGSGLTARNAGVEETMIDVGLVLEPVNEHENTFQRVGYFEQCYWTLDTYPIFAGGKADEVTAITIV